MRTKTAPAFERITVLPFEMKSYEAASGVFVGLASTPQVDRAGEVVSADAMRESAARYMQNPVITMAHDTWEPIGRGLSVNVTDAGTLLEGYVTDKTERGQVARGLLEDKILRSLSIGFNPYSRSYGAHPDGTADYEILSKDADPGVVNSTLVWKRIDWLETAICAIPCNPGASIQLAKSMGLEMRDPRGGQPQEEEARFLSNVERVEKGAESIRNILRHWTKEGRDLSPEVVQRLSVAYDVFAEAVPETDPVTKAIREALAVAKAGRVLSSANRTAVNGAMTALQEVCDRDDASRAGDDTATDEGKHAGPCVLRLPEKPHLVLPA